MTFLYHKPTASRSQAQYILNTFSNILQSVCMDPYQPVSSVCQLSELDTMQVEVWSRILSKDKTACVDRLIEDAAQRTPDVSTLLVWDGQMTYAEFNQTAGKMVRYLASVGVQRGDLVPICFEKFLWTAVVLIALWKLGAGWVPFDPKQPRQRLETIISSAQAQTVIASGTNKELLMGLAPQVVVVDTSLIGKLLSEPYVEFTSQSQPRDISFVMFTSGSTGKPKGVVHDYTSVASSALQHASAMNINSDTRALQFGANTFIISTLEIFTTLIYGGCLYIPSDYDRHTDIRPAIRSFNVNWAIFTLSFARSLNRENVPSLKPLIVAGEAVPQDIIDHWSACAQLINIYGASECSVIMIGRMMPNTPRSCIGRATGGLSWLVDPNDHDRMVPIGSIGELVIEGPTLARGYLAYLEKTQAVYINNPLSANQNGISRRFYKTGDLVRYADDEQVHLIGRKDLQVKIRGQRVELTEIEAHLRAINRTVKTAVSMVHPGGKSILAVFISSQSGFGPEHAYPFHAIPKDKSAMVALAAQMSRELARRLPFIHGSFGLPASGLHAFDRIGQDGPPNALHVW
jgi:amino acid adenylation domain-containing protein